MSQPINLSNNMWSRRPSVSIWSDGGSEAWRRHSYGGEVVSPMVLQGGVMGMTPSTVSPMMGQQPAFAQSQYSQYAQGVSAGVSGGVAAAGPGQPSHSRNGSFGQVSPMMSQNSQMGLANQPQMSQGMHVSQNSLQNGQMLDRTAQINSQIHGLPNKFTSMNLNLNLNNAPAAAAAANTTATAFATNSSNAVSLSCAAEIEDYFASDPHERVHVSLKYIRDRFPVESQYLSDAYQLPKFPMQSSLHSYQLCLVGFKSGRIDVFYLPQELTNIQIGELVIVEADRGRDLGKIMSTHISVEEARLIKLLQLQEQQSAISEDTGPLSLKNFHQANSACPSLHFPKPVVAVAQSAEILQLIGKCQDEDRACRLCLAKISGVVSSSTSPSDLAQMRLIDAEYQFDRKKLIFYYSTNKRIDFRDLVRELFRIYKTRIWMCAVVGLPFEAPGGVSPISTESMTHFDNYTGTSSANSGALTPRKFDVPMVTSSPDFQRAYRRSSIDEHDPLQRIDEQAVASTDFSRRASVPPALQSNYNPVYYNYNNNALSSAGHNGYNSFNYDNSPIQNNNVVNDDIEGLMLKSLVDSINH